MIGEGSKLGAVAPRLPEASHAMLHGTGPLSPPVAAPHRACKGRPARLIPVDGVPSNPLIRDRQRDRGRARD
jgi:hypothetical protein